MPEACCPLGDKTEELDGLMLPPPGDGDIAPELLAVGYGWMLRGVRCDICGRFGVVASAIDEDEDVANGVFDIIDFWWVNCLVFIIARFPSLLNVEAESCIPCDVRYSWISCKSCFLEN